MNDGARGAGGGSGALSVVSSGWGGVLERRRRRGPGDPAVPACSAGVSATVSSGSAGGPATR